MKNWIIATTLIVLALTLTSAFGQEKVMPVVGRYQTCVGNRVLPSKEVVPFMLLTDTATGQVFILQVSTPDVQAGKDRMTEFSPKLIGGK